MKIRSIHIVGILWLFWWFLPEHKLLAQTKVQVVTKTIEQEFVYKAGEHIALEGEKATVQVKGWNQKEIKVILKLISKAPSQEIARQELEYQRYILEKRKETIHLKNYFVLPKGQQELHALLLAEYEIWIPQQASMTITNRYGTTHIEEVHGQLALDSRYGKILLSDLDGKTSIKSYFGDVTAKNISGTIQGTLDHTKTSIEGSSGNISFTNTLGDIILSNIDKVKSLHIEATKSDISLLVKQVWQYQYQFTSQFGEITVPPHTGNQLVKQTSDIATWQHTQSGLPLIQVKTTFGTITLQQQ